MSSEGTITQSTPLLQEHGNEQPSHASEPSQVTESDSLLPRRDVEQGRVVQQFGGFGQQQGLFGVTSVPTRSNEETMEEARGKLVWCCCLMVLMVVLFAILGPIFHLRNKRDPPICYSDRSYYLSVLLSIFLGGAGIDRFYLGYIFIGLLKFFTGGVFGIMWVVDIVLIVVGGLSDSNGCALS